MYGRFFRRLRRCKFSLCCTAISLLLSRDLCSEELTAVELQRVVQTERNKLGNIDDGMGSNAYVCFALYSCVCLIALRTAVCSAAWSGLLDKLGALSLAHLNMR